MYIEAVPNRGSPPAILLRESFRENGRVRKRTLANLSDWPTPLVEGFRTLLKGGVAVAAEGIRIRRALPHGHAAAVLGTIRAIGLDRLLGKPIDKRLVPLAIALIASRLISPASKLATARDLAADTAGSSLGRLLELGAVEESELYRALDWLGARQAAIETALARRHLKDGALVLYDVSSSWLEGRCCELARFGYSRDGKKDGCPVVVEVFEGNTADPMLQATEAALAKLADQIARGTGRKGQDKIARAVGRIENRYKLAKLFDITVDEDGFTFGRNPARIAAEARLAGFYVIATSVENKALAADQVVSAYKGLARVERAFR